MSTIARLNVVISATTDDVTKAINKTQQTLESASRRMTDIGKTLTLGVTAPIVAIGTGFVMAASNAEETRSKFNTVFGSLADGTRDWANTTAEALGRSRVAIEGYLSSLQDTFVPLGFARSEAAEFSKTITTLGIDLASFNNMAEADVLRDLQSALVGNTETVRKFGVIITQATLDQELLNMGIRGGVSAATEAEKVQARLNLIMKGTHDAQGDAARTAGEFANQMRAVAASGQDVAADFGTLIIPTLLKLISVGRNALDFLNGLDDGQRKVILVLALFAASVGPFLLGLGLIAGAVKNIIGLKILWAAASTKAAVAAAATGTASAGATPAVYGLGTAIRFLLGPIGLALMAISLLVAGGIALYKNWDMVKSYGIKAWSDLKLFVLNAANSILGVYEKVYGWMPILGDKVKEARSALSGYVAREQVMNRAWGAGVGVTVENDETQRYVQHQAQVQEAAKKTAVVVADVGNVAVSAAGKASKAAEDTRAAWEKTSDVLGVKLQALRTVHEIAGIAAENQGNKVQSLALKSQQLTKELDAQKQIVSAVRGGYNAMAAAKGTTAEETEKLRLKLLQEQKAQVEIEQQIRATSGAIRDQATQLHELAADVEKAAQKYRDDLMAAQEEYFRKATALNEKLAADEARLTQEYERNINQRASALMNFVGLFDAVASRDVSGDQLLANLRGQVDAFDAWQKDIGDLAAKGVDQGLIEALKQMGPKAGPEIAALNTLTAEQLTEYVSLWQQKSQSARNEAIAQLEGQRAETIQKIQELRNQAAEQLEIYRQEWAKKNEEIRKNAMEEMKRIEDRYIQLTQNSTTYGQRLVQNFAAGIESQFDMLRQTVAQMLMIMAPLDTSGGMGASGGYPVSQSSSSTTSTVTNHTTIIVNSGEEAEYTLAKLGVRAS